MRLVIELNPELRVKSDLWFIIGPYHRDTYSNIDNKGCDYWNQWNSTTLLKENHEEL